MYVLIDRDQMAITHKHSDKQALADLAWIECLNSAIVLPLGKVEHWSREFTPAELKRIYYAATGAELQAYGNVLAHVVHQMALRLPEFICNPAEVHTQRLKVMDGDPRTFQYCPGSDTPIAHKDLFTADPLKCARNEAEEALAATSKPAHVPTTPANNAAGSPFAAQGGAPRVPSAPRVGGSRETIFRVADEMWEKAGKPTDVKAVLDLRKQMMSVLEAQHEIKKTTSSTALGDWQKSRLA